MTNVLTEPRSPTPTTPPDVTAAIDRPVRGRRTARRGARRLHAVTVTVFAISIALFAAASILADTVHEHTEDRLLQRQTRQAGAVLEVSVGNARATLAPAAELAALTDGDPAAFDSAIGAAVTAGRYASVSLWDGGDSDPLIVLGDEPLIEGDTVAEAAMIEAAVTTDDLAIVGILGGDADPRLAYALASQREGKKYVVYIESALPTPRRGVEQTDNAFSNLVYALYLGESETDADLLFSSVEELPIEGRRGTVTIPFGNSKLLLVTAASHVLSGGLSKTLPWIVALVGLALSLGFAALTERLLRRRDDAVAASESLAALSAENARLYAEQRGIAETLQRSLLPDHLPQLPGARVTARYWPAGTASEVGGDFYDLFDLGDGRWGVTIGDVCGKGVSAAALTGVARHTIQAAARHVATPAEVLRWVHEAVRSKGTSMFCTVCFGVLDVSDPRAVRFDVALGGHPPPLLCRSDGSSAEIGVVGTVLGIIEPVLTDATYVLRPGDSLLLFTDGLTDAPQGTAVTMSEVEDAHREDPTREPDTIADQIQDLIEARRPLGSGDDTTLLIVRILGA